MPLEITDDCTLNGACEVQCPNEAIYEPAEYWSYSDGTGLRGKVKKPNGEIIDADTLNEPISSDMYYIVADKCTKCVGTFEEPQCIAVCPMEAITPIDTLTNESLLEKHNWLFQNTPNSPTNTISREKRKIKAEESENTLDSQKENSNPQKKPDGLFQKLKKRFS